MTAIKNTAPAISSREIEFWFEFGSTYSYLAVMRIENLAAMKNVALIWKPFLLGPIFQCYGWNTSPFLLQKHKGEYMWRDMQRQCQKYGIPWTQPSTFPRLAVKPLRIVSAFSDQPWIGEFCKQVMLINFALDGDINVQKTLIDILNQLELPGAEIYAESELEINKLRLRKQTDEAISRGVFGAPMFFAKGEMFWGNDRLEDALNFAAVVESENQAASVKKSIEFIAKGT